MVQVVFSYGPSFLNIRADQSSLTDRLVLAYGPTCLDPSCPRAELSGTHSIQPYVIKLVSDLPPICGFLRVLRFPPPIKLTTTIYSLQIQLNIWSFFFWLVHCLYFFDLLRLLITHLVSSNFSCVILKSIMLISTNWTFFPN